jgi:hypothetical protein
VIEMTGGLGADYTYEAVGIPALMRQTWDMAAIDGTHRHEARRNPTCHSAYLCAQLVH